MTARRSAKGSAFSLSLISLDEVMPFNFQILCNFNASFIQANRKERCMRQYIYYFISMALYFFFHLTSSVKVSCLTVTVQIFENSLDVSLIGSGSKAATAEQVS